MNVFDDNAERYRRRMAPFIPGSPHARGSAIHLGWAPRPELIFFDDFVHINQDSASTNFYNTKELVIRFDETGDLQQLFIKSERTFTNPRILILPVSAESLFNDDQGTLTNDQRDILNNIIFSSNLIRPNMAPGGGTDADLGTLTWNNGNDPNGDLFQTGTNFTAGPGITELAEVAGSIVLHNLPPSGDPLDSVSWTFEGRPISTRLILVFDPAVVDGISYNGIHLKLTSLHNTDSATWEDSITFDGVGEVDSGELRMLLITDEFEVFGG